MRKLENRKYRTSGYRCLVLRKLGGIERVLLAVCKRNGGHRTVLNFQSEAKWEKVLPDISAGKLQKFAQLRDSDLRPHFQDTKMARKTQPRKSWEQGTETEIGTTMLRNQKVEDRTKCV